MSDPNAPDGGAPDPDRIDETLPEAVKGFLRRGAKLENIRLDARGRWTHEGLQFENTKITRLFDRSVDRTEGGTWVLHIPPFTYPIEVEDTGFFVEHIDLSDPGAPELLLSDETREPLAPHTVEYREGGRLYCEIKGGRFRARFKRAPYHSLLELARERDGAVYLRIGDQEILLANLDDLDET